MRDSSGIFFVESPLQLVNAISAVNDFHLQKDSMLIARLNGDPSNDEQIKKIVEDHWQGEFFFHTIRNSRTKYYFFILIIFKLYIKLRKFNINYIFIGEFRSIWMQILRNILKSKNSWMVDDGMSTITIANYLNERRYSTIPLIYKFNNFLNQPINIYSLYENLNIKNNAITIRKNNLNFLKNLKKDQEYDQNNFYFFGQKLYEINTLTLDNEVNLLIEIKQYVREHLDLNMIYISHRGDSEEKLKILRDKKIKIIHPSLPSEIFFAIAKNNIPSNIGSFYSSALYGMKNIYDIKLAISFQFNEKRLVLDKNRSKQISKDFKYLSFVVDSVVKL